MTPRRKSKSWDEIMGRVPDSGAVSTPIPEPLTSMERMIQSGIPKPTLDWPRPFVSTPGARPITGVIPTKEDALVPDKPVTYDFFTDRPEIRAKIDAGRKVFGPPTAVPIPSRTWRDIEPEETISEKVQRLRREGPSTPDFGQSDEEDKAVIRAEAKRLGFSDPFERREDLGLEPELDVPEEILALIQRTTQRSTAVNPSDPGFREQQEVNATLTEYFATLDTAEMEQENRALLKLVQQGGRVPVPGFEQLGGLLETTELMAKTNASIALLLLQKALPGQQEMERRLEQLLQSMGYESVFEATPEAVFEATRIVYDEWDAPWGVKGFLQLALTPEWLIPVVGAPGAIGKVALKALTLPRYLSPRVVRAVVNAANKDMAEAIARTPHGRRMAQQARIARETLAADSPGLAPFLEAEVGVVAKEPSWVAAPRPLTEYIAEVDAGVLGTSLFKKIADNALLTINPSANADDRIKQIYIGSIRQDVETKAHVKVATALLDAHAQGVLFRTGRILPIDKNGFYGNTGKQWGDVFAKPEEYNLTTEQLNYIYDYRKILEDANDMAVSQGLEALPLTTEGWFYIPRQVKAIREVTLETPTNPLMKRLWEEMTDGYQAGIKYNTSPRDTLELYLTGVYKRVNKRQLDDALSQYGIAPRAALPPRIVESVLNTQKGLQRARNAVTTLQRSLMRAKAVLRDVDKKPRPSKTRPTEEAQDQLITEDTLPRDLAGSQPRYSAGYRNEELTFESDLDKALYTVAGTRKLSNRDEAFMVWLRSRLPKVSDADIRAQGAQVRRAIREVFDATPPGETLSIPVQKSRTNLGVSAPKPKAKPKARQKPPESATIRKARKEVEELTEQLKVASARVSAADTKWQEARNIYRSALEGAKNAKVLPGRMFQRTEQDIPVRLWRNRLVPKDDAERLEEAFGSLFKPKQGRELYEGISKPLVGVEIFGNYARWLAATVDLGAPLIHGGFLLATNPVAWARATGRHLQALVMPQVQARYIRNNLSDIQDMIRAGIPVGDVEVFAAVERGGGLPIGKVLEYLPRGAEVRGMFQQAGTQTLGRFQATFNTFLTTARVEMWKSLSRNWDGPITDLGSHIRNMTGGLDSAALGLSRNRRAAEGTWMAFSPKLLRSTVALMSDAATALVKTTGSRVGFKTAPTMREKKAIQAVGTYIIGVMGIYAAAGMAMGKSWTGENGIWEGLNPLKGKQFLSYQINGDWIGVGGQVRALMSFFTKSVWALAPGGDPIENLISADVWDNPILNFLMSRGAPGVSFGTTAIEAVSGGKINANAYENIDDLPDALNQLGTSALPFTLQGWLEGEGLAATITSFAGLRTSAQTPGEKRDAIRNEVLPFVKLEMLTRTDVSDEIKDSFRRANTYKELPKNAQVFVDIKPAVKEAEELLDKRNRERGSWYQEYGDELQALENERNEHLGNLFRKYFYGKDYKFHRHRLNIAFRTNVENVRADYQTRIDKMIEKDDREESNFQFDLDLAVYNELTSDPKFIDPETDEFMFVAWEQALDAEGLSPARIDEIQEYNNRNDPQVEKDYAAAQALLEPYYKLYETITVSGLDPKRKTAWLEYNTTASNPRKNQLNMRYDFTVEKRFLRQNKAEMRADNFAIDTALVTWNDSQPHKYNREGQRIYAIKGDISQAF